MTALDYPHGATRRGCRRARRRAFTLIELLLVTALLGLVVGVIGASLAAGMRAWEAARTFGSAEGEALMALRILHKDLANTFAFYGIPFEGSARRLAFPTILAAEGDGAPQLGTVRYIYAGGSRPALRRCAWAFPGEEPSAAAGETLARAAGAFMCSYRASGPAATWQEAWSSRTNLPCAVRAEIVPESGGRAAPLTEITILTGGANSATNR
jgi:prepilin-type N-terminal cleavage/methylation domain-containing protein